VPSKNPRQEAALGDKPLYLLYTIHQEQSVKNEELRSQYVVLLFQGASGACVYYSSKIGTARIPSLLYAYSRPLWTQSLYSDSVWTRTSRVCHHVMDWLRVTCSDFAAGIFEGVGQFPLVPSRTSSVLQKLGSQVKLYPMIEILESSQQLLMLYKK